MRMVLVSSIAGRSKSQSTCSRSACSQSALFRASLNASDAIWVPMLHTCLKGTCPTSWFVPSQRSSRVSERPWSRPRIPHVPCGLRVAIVDHVSVLVASNAEHYVGFGHLAPFANVPSKRHCSAPHNYCASPCVCLWLENLKYEVEVPLFFHSYSLW